MDEYDIGKAFKRIEDELIRSMIRNFEHHKAEETKEGFQWTQWQVEQLRALEEYKKQNKEKFSGDFAEINKSIAPLIEMARKEGNLEQEEKILKAIKNGAKLQKGKGDLIGAFFQINDRKLDALVKATTDDFKKAEVAILRMADDQYRKTIFTAQVYANAGGTTYEKAVDMAAKDFISKGINCIEYKDGSRHRLEDYASMAIRTAVKRAYLTGEGEKRKEWGVSTVIMNKRGNACPKCLPFVGKILIDDVWSGGSKEDGSYPLMSEAVSAGLYHPNCKDSHTTYFPGISTPPDDEYSRKELKEVYEQYKKEAKEKYAKRQQEKFERLEKNSLDKENQKRYAAKREEWKKKYASSSHIRAGVKKSVEKPSGSDIIKLSDTKEVSQARSVGKIDKNIYKCITEDIVTDEVIMTDERIKHIKERHPNDYERYYEYMKEIVEQPDYIIEANKPNTALILKEIKVSEEKQFKTILRLTTSTDNPGFKNSIITFMKINNKEWNRLLRNKQILYKKE